MANRNRQSVQPQGRENSENIPAGLKESIDAKKNRLGRQQVQVLLRLNALPIKQKREKPTDIFKKKGWARIIISQMSEGASLLEVLAELGISRSQHHRLMKISKLPTHKYYVQAKKYAESVSRGLEISEAWWLRAGREGLSLGKFFGSSLFYMNMKNRFGWAEKLKSDYGEETLKTLQDTITELARIQPAVKKSNGIKK